MMTQYNSHGMIHTEIAQEMGKVGSVNRNGCSSKELACFTGTGINTNSMNKEAIQFDQLGMLRAEANGADIGKAADYANSLLQGMLCREGSLDSNIKFTVSTLPFVPPTVQGKADNWQDRLPLYIDGESNQKELKEYFMILEKQYLLAEDSLCQILKSFGAKENTVITVVFQGNQWSLLDPDMEYSTSDLVFHFVVTIIDGKYRVCHEKSHAFVQAPPRTPNAPNAKDIRGILALMNHNITKISLLIDEWFSQHMDSIKTPLSDAAVVNAMFLSDDTPQSNYNQIIDVNDRNMWFQIFTMLLSSDKLSEAPFAIKVALWRRLVALGNTLILCDPGDKDMDDEHAIKMFANLIKEAHDCLKSDCDQETQQLLHQVLKTKIDVVITDNKSSVDACNRRFEIFISWLKEQFNPVEMDKFTFSWRFFTMSQEGEGTYNQMEYNTLNPKNVVLVAKPTPILGLINVQNVKTVWFQG